MSHKFRIVKMRKACCWWFMILSFNCLACQFVASIPNYEKKKIFTHASLCSVRIWWQREQRWRKSRQLHFILQVPEWDYTVVCKRGAHCVISCGTLAQLSVMLMLLSSLCECGLAWAAQCISVHLEAMSTECWVFSGRISGLSGCFYLGISHRNGWVCRLHLFCPSPLTDKYLNRQCLSPLRLLWASHA